ncbi:hypothetical protein EXN32_07975 [Agrobacterium tumefaciens]|uniref:hypothetical protein n=1 Tax=Agrobacterium TaxID=357 RepID=UPI00115DF74A|nr:MULTISPECIES: hypothetical protein [Agrobacterium]MDA5245342.1 hypothetical protein [Agrobacterium sp. MAFF310724]MDA5246228.1 hypothetical protein [Agrobacterium sp. MAFF210268]TRB17653.1 hypothetical protein EXN32_07975 [Agrobacterium tumefaciens]
MPAVYDGIQFKTPLEARWAAFFDLAGWDWKVNHVPVFNWSPDFRVTFPCRHSECNGSHTLLVSVLPITGIEDAQSHPALSHRYGIEGPDSEVHPEVDAGAVFGMSPNITRWEFSHGAGGGLFDVNFFVEDANALWVRAATLVS